MVSTDIYSQGAGTPSVIWLKVTIHVATTVNPNFQLYLHASARTDSNVEHDACIDLYTVFTPFSEYTLVIIPEFPVGAASALATSFGAYIVTRKRKGKNDGTSPR